MRAAPVQINREEAEYTFLLNSKTLRTIPTLVGHYKRVNSEKVPLGHAQKDRYLCGVRWTIHTSYHTGGEFHWKVGDITQDLGRKPPLRNIASPILLQGATAGKSDDVLDRFELTEFDDIPVDRVIYLDNRKLPNSVYYQIWAVPPFMHGDVPLMIDDPAHVHFCTHTKPWLMAIIYEQGTGERKA